MGRAEKPLDPAAGPVQRFAHELRELRRSAGSPTYREMSRSAGYSAPTLSAAAGGERLPSMAVALAYVEACGGSAREWERRWREASAALTELAVPDPDEPSPYRGLARFGTDDGDLFFGRDQLVEDLAGLVRKHRFVALVGASGSGKSSLLRAGLVPALRGLAEGEEGRPAAIRICTPLSAQDSLLRPVDGDADTVLIVDQFEEVFTLCQDPLRRAEFIQHLLDACADRLRVVVAIRADFYGRCADHRDLVEALNAATLLVGPMAPEQVREAIVKPAAAGRLVVERALTARIISDVAQEPGALPLMSHALLELWRRRRARTLTLEAYEAIGGVQGAVAHTAEEVFADFTDDQAATARALLLRLITPGTDGAPDTRRPARRAELLQSESAEAVLEALVRARLVTVDDTGVDLVHESLITAWPRLRAWVETDRERLRHLRHLTASAEEWEQLGRDPGALYRGARLLAARDALTGPDGPATDLTPLEREFLVTSIRSGRLQPALVLLRRFRRSRWWRLMWLALLVIAVAWTVWFLNRPHS